MTARLRVKLRQITERQAIRAWEFRQRKLSHGVWFRLRLALVGAESAWAIGDADAARLRASGVACFAVGHELNPKKDMFAVSRHELLRLPSRVEVPMRLGPELLYAENLVLVLFDTPGDVLPQ